MLKQLIIKKIVKQQFITNDIGVILKVFMISCLWFIKNVIKTFVFTFDVFVSRRNSINNSKWKPLYLPGIQTTKGLPINSKGRFA